MSTRASIVISDDRDVFYFYQHSDGYPTGCGKGLQDFLDSEIAKHWADDIDRLATCLMLEYNKRHNTGDYLPDLEITSCVHGDEQWQYVIDAKTLQLTICPKGDFQYD